MICSVSSKQRSFRSARTWKRTSPGVDTATRGGAPISASVCSSAGRCAPKRKSHASEPKETTHESPAEGSRAPTARTSPARSPHSPRTVSRLSSSRFTSTTRKIASRVSGSFSGLGVTGECGSVFPAPERGEGAAVRERLAFELLLLHGDAAVPQAVQLRIDVRERDRRARLDRVVLAALGRVEVDLDERGSVLQRRFPDEDRRALRLDRYLDVGRERERGVAAGDLLREEEDLELVEGDV